MPLIIKSTNGAKKEASAEVTEEECIKTYLNNIKRARQEIGGSEMDVLYALNDILRKDSHYASIEQIAELTKLENGKITSSIERLFSAGYIFLHCTKYTTSYCINAEGIKLIS